MLFPLAVMPLRVLGFGSTHVAGEVLRDCFGRSISFDPELRPSVGRQTKAFWRCHLVLMQPSGQPTVNQYTTAGYCYSVTISPLCPASTANVLHRYVWRATSESASGGYQVNSTGTARAAERTTTRMIPPKVSQTTSVQVKNRHSRYLAHGLIVNPISARADRPHDLARWLLLKSSVALRKKRKTPHKGIWTTMESEDRKEHNPFTLMEDEKQVPPQVVFDASVRGGRGQQPVSSSDEGKVTADRVRVAHRTGRVQVRDLLCVVETKSVTGRTPEIRATSVREFFVWSCLSRNNSATTLEVDRPTESINPFSSKNHRVGEARNCWQIPSSFRFSQGCREGA